MGSIEEPVDEATLIAEIQDKHCTHRRGDPLKRLDPESGDVTAFGARVDGLADLGARGNLTLRLVQVFADRPQQSPETMTVHLPSMPSAALRQHIARSSGYHLSARSR